MKMSKIVKDLMREFETQRVYFPSPWWGKEEKVAEKISAARLLLQDFY